MRRLAWSMAVVLGLLGQAAGDDDDSGLMAKLAPILRALGLTISADDVLSNQGAREGAIWVVPVDGGAPRQVTRREDLSWPVFEHGDRRLFALAGDRLVSIDLDGGSATELSQVPGVVQLIGGTPDGRILAVAREGSFGRPVLVSPDGNVETLPAVAEADDERAMAALLRPTRDFADGSGLVLQPTVSTDSLGYEVRRFDVYLRRDGGARNLTHVSDGDCGQPSRSSDGGQVAYVVQPAAF